MNRGVSIAAATALVALPLAGCGSSSSDAGDTPGTTTVRGSITLPADGSDSNEPTDTCNGWGGYEDITTGAKVTVTNASGTVIGLGSLGYGIVGSDGSCKFKFKVPDVPLKSKFYKVTVANRAAPNESRVEIQRPVNLTL